MKSSPDTIALTLVRIKSIAIFRPWQSPLSSNDSSAGHIVGTPQRHIDIFRG